MGNKNTIAIVNRLSDNQIQQHELQKIIKSINILLEELCQIWNIPKKKVILLGKEPSPLKFFGYVLLEKGSDEDTTLGHHTLDIHNKPFSLISYQAHIKNNIILNYLENPTGIVDMISEIPRVFISKTLSHEIFEMVVNPFLNQESILMNNGRKIYREVCDSVRSGEILINGVILSNFVYPSWFLSDGIKPYDHLTQLTKPFTLGSSRDYFTYEK